MRTDEEILEAWPVDGTVAPAGYDPESKCETVRWKQTPASEQNSLLLEVLLDIRRAVVKPSGSWLKLQTDIDEREDAPKACRCAPIEGAACYFVRGHGEDGRQTEASRCCHCGRDYVEDLGK